MIVDKSIEVLETKVSFFHLVISVIFFTYLDIKTLIGSFVFTTVILLVLCQLLETKPIILGSISFHITLKLELSIFGLRIISLTHFTPFNL